MVMVQYFVTVPQKIILSYLRQAHAFLPTTFDQIEMETQSRYQYAYLINMHQLMYDLNFPGQNFSVTVDQISNTPFHFIKFIIRCALAGRTR